MRCRVFLHRTVTEARVVEVEAKNFIEARRRALKASKLSDDEGVDGIDADDVEDQEGIDTPEWLFEVGEWCDGVAGNRQRVSSVEEA